MLNFFLGWLIKAVLFVPALLTLGLLFLFIPFIVNTVLLWLTDKLIGSFRDRDDGRAAGVVGAVITLVNGVFHLAIQPPDGPSRRRSDALDLNPEGV